MKMTVKVFASISAALLLASCGTDESASASASSEGKVIRAYLPSDDENNSLKKTASIDSDVFTVATAYEYKGGQVVVTWKDQNEKFVTLPMVGFYAGSEGLPKLEDDANESVITYKLQSIKENNEDKAWATFVPQYNKKGDRYCEENPSNCVALYPALEWGDIDVDLAKAAKQILAKQSYKEYTESMLDSIQKFDLMRAEIKADGDELSVRFYHMVAFIELKLPAQGKEVKAVGLKGVDGNDYEVVFEKAIPAKTDIKVILTTPVLRYKANEYLAFYVKTKSGKVITYKQTLVKDLSFEQADYKKINFSNVEPDAEIDDDENVLVDERDGQTYKTVVIGSQTWMAENLKYADEEKTPNLKDGNWCYEGDSKNCETYGRLYTWAAAMDFEKKYIDVRKRVNAQTVYRGICPEGWHIPNEADWNTLADYVDGLDKIKDNVGDWLKSNSEWNGNDGVGFTALPSGYKQDVDFLYQGSVANFWSAAESNAGEAKFRGLESNYSYLYGTNKNKASGYSVRCLMD